MNKKKTAVLRDSLEYLTQIFEFFRICPSCSCSEHPYKIQQNTGMLYSRWITSFQTTNSLSLIQQDTFANSS